MFCEINAIHNFLCWPQNEIWKCKRSETRPKNISALDSIQHSFQLRSRSGLHSVFCVIVAWRGSSDCCYLEPSRVYFWVRLTTCIVDYKIFFIQNGEGDYICHKTILAFNKWKLYSKARSLYKYTFTVGRFRKEYFQSIQLITLPLLVAGTLGDLSLVTKSYIV